MLKLAKISAAFEISWSVAVTTATRDDEERQTDSLTDEMLLAPAPKDLACTFSHLPRSYSCTQELKVKDNQIVIQKGNWKHRHAIEEE